jgi:protein-disulfide isomerase
MHDVLYARQRSWSDLPAPTSEFTKYAQEIGLNEGAFTACVGGSRHARKVDNDRAEGTRNTVRATPTFFVNNRRIEGVVTEAQWEQVLEAELSATSSSGATSTP